MKTTMADLTWIERIFNGQPRSAEVLDAASQREAVLCRLSLADQSLREAIAAADTEQTDELTGCIAEIETLLGMGGS
jgi:hypothetical protein